MYFGEHLLIIEIISNEIVQTLANASYTCIKPTFFSP